METHTMLITQLGVWELELHNITCYNTCSYYTDTFKTWENQLHKTCANISSSKFGEVVQTVQNSRLYFDMMPQFNHCFITFHSIYISDKFMVPFV